MDPQLRLGAIMPNFSDMMVQLVQLRICAISRPAKGLAFTLKFPSMFFLGLPTEIIQQIIQQCQPISFENMILSCKRVHNVGQYLIAEHNNYKRTFRDIEIKAEWGDNADICRGLVKLLAIIARDPRAAFYVRTLTIQDYRFDDVLKENMGLYLGSDGRTESIDSTAWKLVADMITQSPWLKAAGYEQRDWLAVLAAVQEVEGYIRAGVVTHVNTWRDERRKERLVALFTLLLTQLTQLRILNIKYDIQFEVKHDDDDDYNDDDEDDYDNGVSIIQQAKKVLELMSLSTSRNTHDISRELALHSIANLPTSPLEELTTLNYCPPCSGYSTMGAVALNQFITLPMLRNLRVTNLRIDFDHGHTHSWPTRQAALPTTPSFILSDPYQHSYITTLELAHCCVDPAGIAALLERLPHLTTLRYTHQTKHWATEENEYTAGWDFDAGQFLEAIADPSRFTHRSEASSSAMPAHSITDLSIGFEYCYGRVTTGVSGKTLQQFTNLKRLALDVLVFFGQKSDMQDEEEEETTSQEGSDEQVAQNSPPLENDDCILNMQLLDDIDWEPKMPRLVDFLPPTLERLELFVQRENMEGWCLDPWTKLLDGLREGRQERLPNLETFVVRENSLMHRGLGPSGLYREVEVHDDPASVAYRHATLAAGAEFISAEKTMMSWRQELEEEGALVYSSGYWSA